MLLLLAEMSIPETERVKMELDNASLSPSELRLLIRGSIDRYADTAVSCYGDMLNDDERNRAFYQAIEISVRRLAKTEEFNPTGDLFFNCCDIGTGSGILSMMIAKTFIELDYKSFHVTSFEMDDMMAKCAKEVIRINNLSDYITVLPMDANQYKGVIKFDLLVAELLDTELIGEGCLTTYLTAVTSFCKPECLFVPYGARILIEPVASSFLFKRNRLRSSWTVPVKNEKKVTINSPQIVDECSGLMNIDDIQASALIEGKDFTRITKPQTVFEFTFNRAESLEFLAHKTLNFKLEKELDQEPVLIMWWEAIMFDKTQMVDERYLLGAHSRINLEVLSCAPTWARSSELLKRDKLIREMYGRDVWREHWIQGVYYLNSLSTLEQIQNIRRGDTLTVYASHDRVSYWFDLKSTEHLRQAPNCICTNHSYLSRSDVALLNDEHLMSKIIEAVICRRPDVSRGNLVVHNPLSDCNPKWQVDFHTQTNEHAGVLADPCLSSIHSIGRTFRIFNSCSNVGEPIESFEIKFTQVKFENLHRMVSSRGMCEGFDLSPVDKLIRGARSITKEFPDSYYLWEYKNTRLDEKDYILYSSSIHGVLRPEEKEFKREFSLPIRGTTTSSAEGSFIPGWALVFWLEVRLQSTNELISCGPTTTTSYGELTDWYRHCKQEVYFLDDYSIARRGQAGLRETMEVELSLNTEVVNYLKVEIIKDYFDDPVNLRRK